MTYRLKWAPILFPGQPSLPLFFQGTKHLTDEPRYHVMAISGDAIADVVLREFDNWPQKRKPLVRSDGIKEWVPLSGIVAQGKESLTCLAVATGMKCLPRNKISQAQGVVLHDWHAEVLAIRSFNRFLLDECSALASSEKQSSKFIRLRSEDERTDTHFQPFALHEDINLHMYCSEAPCGDASMELTMAAQEDATPWEINTSPAPATSLEDMSQKPGTIIEEPILHGRGYFSALGLVRRKPSRPDAPPTLSKSCSDKIALKQSTSLLSSVTSLLISPENCYIHCLVLPSSQHSSTACTRAFSSSGRLASLAKSNNWSGGYRSKFFHVLTTEKEFKHSRRQVLGQGERIVPSGISSFSTPHTSETLIGGTLQGRKQFSPKGASLVSKRPTWRLALEIAALVSVPAIERCLKVPTYGAVKASTLLEERRKVKSDARKVLGGWIRNEGGENFTLEETESDTKQMKTKIPK